MLIEMMHAKIHRAVVTDANLNYIGSITIDETLLKAAGILPYQKVQVVNINNGSRLETYAVAGEPGSGVITLNGAAARLAQPQDLIIIMAYALMEPEQAAEFRPKVVFVDSRNHLKELAEHG